MTAITVYDGNDTIGGNKIYVEENGKGLFLDFGANLHNYDKFFQPYIQPRAYRGIHDLWLLNLIPHLNIYRKDLIPIDLDVTSAPKLDIKAVLLSHVHMDHYGNIGFLDENIPVVASSFTFSLLKGLQDSYTPNAGSEVIYINKRKPHPPDERLLTRGDNYGRDLIATDSYNENLEHFLWQASRKRGGIEKGELSLLKESDLPFSVTPYETDHSVYGSIAYILEGEHSIAYTGDIRLHGEREMQSKHFIDSAKNSEILIIEGTRLTGENIFDSENVVLDYCRRAIDISKGLVIADFSNRNLERLELFKQIASKTNRQLIIAARDAYLLYALEIVDMVDHLEDILVYHRPMTRPPFWETSILQDKKRPNYITNEDIKDNPDGYILCFSFGDVMNFLDITPVRGIYIYSSPGAFKTEQEFDFIRLNRWLKSYGIRPYGFKIDKVKGRERPSFTRGFHASGHASENELEWIIDRIDPDIIIPVHTENSDWFREHFKDKAKILKKGEKLDL